MNIDYENFDLIETSILNNSVAEWGTAVLMITVVFFGLIILKKVILTRLKSLSGRGKINWMESLFDALSQAKLLILLIISIYIGLQGLTLSETVSKYMQVMAFCAFFVQIGLWLRILLNGWIATYREKQIKTNPAALTTLGAVKFAGHSLIWLAVTLLILDNIGMDITALVAGLGVGGIAVALAVQNILGDLFASLSIILDKTFVVGDFIIIDDYLGSVESIGLKTTRIRSLSGEQIVFSNTDLLKGRIRNYGRMFERRVVVTLGVTYDTPREKLEAIPNIIKDAIEEQDNVRFDRAHFFKYADFSLNFEYVYYVLSPDYNEYMDIQQAINLTIHEQFESKNIDFAFPTRTIHIQSAVRSDKENAEIMA